MNFTLFYQGELPSNGDKIEKNRIRLLLHPQIQLLWKQEPLSTLWLKKENSKSGPDNPLLKRINGFGFLPVVTSNLHLLAE